MCPHGQIHREGTSSNKKIRCILAHDHVLLRQGLRRLLEDEPDIEVVAEAGNPTEALKLASEYQPEVVITDASIFRLAAQPAESLILQESPHSAIVFLTEDDGGELRQDQRARGISAVRQTSAKELVEMVRRAHSAERAVVEEMPRKGEDKLRELRTREQVLTAREREVLELLAEGRTVRSVAGILGLSVKTVDAHKFNLMRKLGLHNKAELVMWAIQKRIVKLPANF